MVIDRASVGAMEEDGGGGSGLSDGRGRRTNFAIMEDVVRSIV